MVEIPLIVLLLIVLASLAVGGWANSVISRVLEHRRGGSPREPRAVEPVCGCGHHIAFHDPRVGQCHAEVKVPTRWVVEHPDLNLKKGEQAPVAWENRPCPCRRYVGPEPMVTMYAPELAPEAVQEIASEKD